MTRLRRGASGTVGPARALIDPSSQQGNLLCGQRCPFTVRRHDAGVFVQSGDECNQPTRRAIAGDDALATVASVERPRLDIEPQPSFLLFRAVARVASLAQQRLDIRDKIDLAIGCIGQRLDVIRHH